MKYLFSLIAISFLSLNNIEAQVVEVISQLGGPDALAIKDNTLYIAEYDAGKISIIDITDQSPVAIDIVTGLNEPNGIVLNGNDLYISQSSANKISKIDITDPSPVAIDVVTGLNRPEGILIKDNYLYISEYYGSKISKVDITAPSPVAIDVITGLINPSGIALDGNELYIAEYNAGKISKIDITDPSPTAVDVITGLNGPYEVAIKVNELFIVEFDEGRISSLDLDNLSLPATVLADGLSQPDGIALSDLAIYFSEYNVNTVSKINIINMELIVPLETLACFGDNTGSILVDATSEYPPFTYTWDNALAMGNNPMNLPAGTYCVTVTDMIGASLAACTDILEPASALEVDMTEEPANPGNMGGTATATVTGGTIPYTYSWDTAPIQTTATAIDLSSGIYNVTVTDANGCEVVESIYVGLMDAVDELTGLSHFDLFPNPTRGKLFVELDFEQAMNISIKLFNKLGQELSNQRLSGTMKIRETIDLTALPSGMYFLSISSGDSHMSRKVILN